MTTETEFNGKAMIFVLEMLTRITDMEMDRCGDGANAAVETNGQTTTSELDEIGEATVTMAYTTTQAKSIRMVEEHTEPKRKQTSFPEPFP